MTTRAKLQEKSLDELRTIAASIDVADHASLQKSKLIAAILDSDKFEVSDEPTPVEVPDIVARRPAEAAASDAGDDDPQPRSNQIGGGGRSSQGSRGDYEDRGNRRRSRRGGRPGGQGGQQGGSAGNESTGEAPQQWDDADLEDREGILDVLPEGYGFLRCTADPKRVQGDPEFAAKHPDQCAAV